MIRIVVLWNNRSGIYYTICQILIIGMPILLLSIGAVTNFSPGITLIQNHHTNSQSSVQAHETVSSVSVSRDVGQGNKSPRARWPRSKCSAKRRTILFLSPAILIPDPCVIEYLRFKSFSLGELIGT